MIALTSEEKDKIEKLGLDISCGTPIQDGLTAPYRRHATVAWINIAAVKASGEEITDLNEGDYFGLECWNSQDKKPYYVLRKMGIDQFAVNDDPKIYNLHNALAQEKKYRLNLWQSERSMVPEGNDEGH